MRFQTSYQKSVLYDSLRVHIAAKLKGVQLNFSVWSWLNDSVYAIMLFANPKELI